MIYLDNSATTRVDDDVLESMLPWLKDGFGNASSMYAIGRHARVVIEAARTEIASLINAHPAEIIFTSGGTESNNAILKSVMRQSRLADAIAVSATEHHAVLHPCHELADQGVPCTILSVNADGRLDVSSLPLVNTSRLLVSVMHANNETGVMQPLQQIRQLVPDALLHSDMVQSFGKVPIDVQKLGLDFASFSAHKIHGPKGIGAMYIRKGIDFKAHQHGGAQERNRRAGTEPTALIIGFLTAARNAVAHMTDRAQHMHLCIDMARTKINESIPQVRVNTPAEDVLPNILNISFNDADKLDGESILQNLDIAGVAVSNGSACVSGSVQPSHVLAAMGRSTDESKAALRISVSKDTTHKEVSDAVTICARIIREMRG